MRTGSSSPTNGRDGGGERRRRPGATPSAVAPSRARSGRRRGSRWRSPPRSTRGRSPTCAGTWRRSRARRPRRRARRTAPATRAASARSRRRTSTVASTCRRGVLAHDRRSIARSDGSAPPGKMYLLIHVYWSRVASIRSCASRIAWMPMRPPGASSAVEGARSTSASTPSPTASIISTLTTAS